LEPASIGHASHTPRRKADRNASQRRLATVLVLLAGYMVAEAVGGWISGSLALLADAGHMLSDVAALALALFALWAAERPATGRQSYGWYRIEILAALVNGALLGAIAILIVVHAIDRIGTPRPIESGLMIAVASGGLAVNVVALALLARGRHAHAGHAHGLNERAAWLHVVGDTLGSVGAVLSALAIRAFGWTWTDPVASIAIALLVIVSSWSLLRETVSVLMESAPGHIDVDLLRAEMLAVEGVELVADLHVWSITSGFEALSAHVSLAPGHGARAVLAKLRALACDRFGIDHVTIEIDPGDDAT
jgi:cobalt-zinc-cadmium efflux system protein